MALSDDPSCDMRLKHWTVNGLHDARINFIFIFLLRTTKISSDGERERKRDRWISLSVGSMHMRNIFYSAFLSAFSFFGLLFSRRRLQLTKIIYRKYNYWHNCALRQDNGTWIVVCIAYLFIGYLCAQVDEQSQILNGTLHRYLLYILMDSADVINITKRRYFHKIHAICHHRNGILSFISL